MIGNKWVYKIMIIVNDYMYRKWIGDRIELEIINDELIRNIHDNEW